MYQAAIVDDELDILNSTKKMLAEQFSRANTAVAFDFFPTVKLFLPCLKTISNTTSYF